MFAIESYCRSLQGRELFTAIRDLATSLAGDPIDGDAIVRQALRRSRLPDDLRDAVPDLEELGDTVLTLCLENAGCPDCAKGNDWRGWRGPEDHDEDEDDGDDEEDDRNWLEDESY